MTLNSYEKLTGGKFLSPKTIIHTENSVLKSFIKIFYNNTENIYGNIYFKIGIDSEIVAKIHGNFGEVYKKNSEEYVIILEDDITVYAESKVGFIYAACDLWRMSDRDFIKQGIIYNCPLAEMRYLKMYMPAEGEIEDFKKIVDFCCYCRCNGIMIEVGGAMEYKRRPEINEKWVEYSNFMREFSGKTETIAGGYGWPKNSIHIENAGGKYLKQETIRELVDYCNDRGIELIPETPCLSHCDYLILPYPEIAERKEDPYPDTYCPSNPKVYEILFDVLEEVIEVFKPKHINIGHDEYFSIGLCERCKERDPADIYADDVIKIHDFLAERGIRTMLWADKIVEITQPDGSKWGGAEYYYLRNGCTGCVPATYKSIERIPKDIICINWMANVGRVIDNKYIEHGFDFVHGNFVPEIMLELKDRFDAGSKGGGQSNWSAANLEYMQYNRVLFEEYYASILFWNEGYADDKYDETLITCFKDMFTYSSAEKYAVPHIEFTHATTFFRQADVKEDGNFIDYERDTIGKYIVEYTDGTKYDIPLLYTQNICHLGRKWHRTCKEPLFDVDFILYGTNYSRSDIFYDVDRLLIGTGYSTMPVKYGAETYFKYVVVNPYPDKQIKSISVEEAKGKEGTIIVKNIAF